MAFVGFNANNMPAQAARPDKELLPNGTKRRGYILSSEEKTAASGSTYILYTIIDEHKESWRYMVMLSGSDKAVAFGQDKHNQLCLACGLLSFGDSSELHNREFEIVIGIEPARDNFPEKNNVKYVNPLPGSPPPVAALAPDNTIIDDEIPF